MSLYVDFVFYLSAPFLDDKVREVSYTSLKQKHFKYTKLFELQII